MDIGAGGISVISAERAGFAAHAERIHSAIGGNGAARSALIASWQRSARLHGLQPQNTGRPQTISEQELRQLREHSGALIHLAQPVLDRLFLSVGGIGCCVLLADSNGVPAERRGAAADDDTFRQWGLWTGAIWSEASEGTNGIGTCIVEQRAVTIHREQHFHARNAGLSCSVAPIHDYLGRLVAVLDVSSCRSDLTEAYAGLIFAAVNDAARKIETDYFRYHFQQARIVFAPVAEHNSGALLAIDRDDMVIGASRAARIALGLGEDGLKGPVPAADFFGNPDDQATDLAEAERGVIIRALARAEGKVSLAAKILGMSRATLHRKLNRLQILRPQNGR
ncbi:GAF domain-containing protein [Pseudochrobactrum sp. HB0163]|uniref:GAF domain-containing protein n=1 Tax=Pseudochrobactrum sp. HB0163 TaxID=3450708 RepID=UPI003F6E3155